MKVMRLGHRKSSEGFSGSEPGEDSEILNPKQRKRQLSMFLWINEIS